MQENGQWCGGGDGGRWQSFKYIYGGQKNNVAMVKKEQWWESINGEWWKIRNGGNGENGEMW